MDTETPRALVELVDEGVAVATVTIDGAVPHLFVVDAVARLSLAARRLGWSVRLRDAGAELAEVLALAGLGEMPYRSRSATGAASDHDHE